MTAQVHNTLAYKDQRYNIIGVHGKGLLTPEDLGIQTIMKSTACYRGYVTHYLVIDTQLELNEMEARVTGDQNPTIKGYEDSIQINEFIAKNSGEVIKDCHYENLDISCPFSGGILIATGFIRALYVHMGFGKPYQYENVIELLFRDGKLVEEIDHSAKAEQWRNQVVSHQEDRENRYQTLIDNGYSSDEAMKEVFRTPNEPDIRQGIEWRFSLDYDSWF